MGVITRSEASHRLKIISSQLSCAIINIRDGDWEAAAKMVEETETLISRILPHLNEAAAECPKPLVGSLKYGVPPDQERLASADELEAARQAVRAGRGGMGYRGSGRSKPDPNGIYKNMSSNKPPAPIDLPKPIVTPKKPTVPKPIVTPPPPKPIVTPPPNLKKLGETRTFDLSRITGHIEWFERQKANPAESATDYEMTDAWDRLSQEERDIITRKYRETKEPVTL